MSSTRNQQDQDDETFSVISTPSSLSLSLKSEDVSDGSKGRRAGHRLADLSTIPSLRYIEDTETVVNISYYTLSDMPAAQGVPLRRSRFYMGGDELLTILIGNTQFKVHSYFFKRDSEPFRALLRTRSDPSEPLVLPDTTASDLECFLDILYPTDFGAYAASTVSEWLAILRVAHRWRFESVHQLALSRLGPLAAPVDHIVCARDLGAPEAWRLSAYVELCRRPAALTLEEGKRLGMQEVICVFDAWKKLNEMREHSAEHIVELVQNTLQEHGLLSLDTEEGVVQHPTGLDSLDDIGVGSCGIAADTVQIDHDDFLSEDGQGSLEVEEQCPAYRSSLPFLDIQDGNQRSIFENLHSTEGYAECDTGVLRLQRHERKLLLTVDEATFGSTAAPYINGRECTGGTFELSHGDIIAFLDNIILSGTLGDLVFSAGSGYVVCRQHKRAPKGRRSDWYQHRNKKPLQICQDNIRTQEARLAAMEECSRTYEDHHGIGKYTRTYLESQFRLLECIVEQDALRLLEAAQAVLRDPFRIRDEITAKRPRRELLDAHSRQISEDGLDLGNADLVMQELCDETKL